jgi:hypothetical protein
MFLNQYLRIIFRPSQFLLVLPLYSRNYIVRSGKRGPGRMGWQRVNNCQAGRVSMALRSTASNWARV